MIRIAAVGDIHVGDDNAGEFRAGIEPVGDHADVLLLAGDLTRCGSVAEATLVAEGLAAVAVPVVAVLGNHDHHADQPVQVRAALERAGVCVLEGEAIEVDVDGVTVGVGGAKGFGSGFVGACASNFGEPEMKQFTRLAMTEADRLAAALDSLATDVRIALTHYSPVAATLRGEPLEIHPFLGSYLLAEAIDDRGVQLAVHGHAHRGIEHGMTDGGVVVRNVAQPVLRCAYKVYELEPSEQRRFALAP